MFELRKIERKTNKSVYSISIKTIGKQKLTNSSFLVLRNSLMYFEQTSALRFKYSN